MSQPPVNPTFIIAFACVGRVNWHSFLAITFRNIQQYFVQLRRSTDDNINVPLQRIENALGHYLHFTRTVDGTLNRLNFNTSQFDHVKDNRIKQWRDQEYAYDAWGNLIEKRSGISKLQTFSYDCENRLVMGARSGDGMANHHLVPEELIKSTQFKSMFGRLKKIGWDPDGASNGIFLPGSKDLAQTTGMPGHWSNHGQYTEAVKNKLVKLNNNLSSLTDMDLALGVKNVQAWAAQGLEGGLFKLDSITGRLL